MLNPLPDKEIFETEISNLFIDGDITDYARYMQIGRTCLSKMLNPHCLERHNPFWLTTGALWASDAKGDGKADKILSLIQRNRALWLPAPVVRSDPAKATKKIGDELFELVEKELDGCSDEILLKEAGDVLEAARGKVDEILARHALTGAARG